MGKAKKNATMSTRVSRSLTYFHNLCFYGAGKLKIDKYLGKLFLQNNEFFCRNWNTVLRLAISIIACRVQHSKKTPPEMSCVFH